MINLKKKELCSLDVIDAKTYLNYLSQQRTKNIEFIDELKKESTDYYEKKTNKILIVDSLDTIESINFIMKEINKNMSYWDNKIKQQNDRYNKIHRINLVSAGVK